MKMISAICQTIKDLWQGILLIVLLCILLPCIDLFSMTFVECVVIVAFSINILIEAVSFGFED